MATCEFLRWMHSTGRMIVIDEELVQNGVRDGKFVKNFVMDA